jgi:8-oxo-dGTP diphosphatase
MDGKLHIALVRRAADPFSGVLALPGGYVHPAEDADVRDAAERVLREKAHLESPYLEQLGVFSGAARDPRGWSVSLAWFALVSHVEGDPDATVRWVEVSQLRSLPFDHKEIVVAALERVRSKSGYTSLPVHLCAEPFTLPQLQAAYEAVILSPINKVSFRRKMQELGFVEPVEGAMESGGAHRPAQLYRLRDEFRRSLSKTDRGINSGS